MRWKPHRDKDGNAFSLSHLHPLRYEVVLPASANLPEVHVNVHIGFGMHCFTRKIEEDDEPTSSYSDNRESRTFCHERYHFSMHLPEIAKTLATRQLGFAKDENYVTIDVNDIGDTTVRYAVFLNVKAWKKGEEKNSVLVVIQSAYVLSAGQTIPGKGKVRFSVLLGHALRGTKPKKPR
ncbi:hypothetical protein PQ786_13775 [Alcaligenes faecalis]